MQLLQIQFMSFVLPAITSHPIELLEFQKSHRRFPVRGAPVFAPSSPFRSKSQNEENLPPIGHVSISSAVGAFDSPGKRLNRYSSTPLNNIYYLSLPSPLFLALRSEHKEQAFPFSPPPSLLQWLSLPLVKKFVNKGFYTVFCIVMHVFSEAAVVQVSVFEKPGWGKPGLMDCDRKRKNALFHFSPWNTNVSI